MTNVAIFGAGRTHLWEIVKKALETPEEQKQSLTLPSRQKSNCPPSPERSTWLIRIPSIEAAT